MKIKRVLIFLILGMFLVNFASAQGCASEGWKGYSKLYENKTITINCPTCNFINFTVVDPQNHILLNNVQMLNDTGGFYYNFLGNNLTHLGTYQINGYSNLDIPLSLCFDVTLSGGDNSLGAYALLLTIIILLLLMLIWINIKFNSERRRQLYVKIVDGYFKFRNKSENNLGTVILYVLGYSILKNIFVFYYLIIVAFLFVLVELVEAYSISSLVILLTTILSVALWGFVLVFVIMIFGLFELIKNLLEDVSNSFMGIKYG